MTKLAIKEIGSILIGKFVLDGEGDAIGLDMSDFEPVHQKDFREYWKILKIAAKFNPRAKRIIADLKDTVWIKTNTMEKIRDLTYGLDRSFYPEKQIGWFMESNFGLEYYKLTHGFYNETLVKSEYIKAVERAIAAKESDLEWERKSKRVLMNNTTGVNAPLDEENQWIKDASIRGFQSDINALKEMKERMLNEKNM